MRYRWQQASSDKRDDVCLDSRRRLIDQDNKLTRLERENVKLKQEVETLKKVAAYFAREAQISSH